MREYELVIVWESGEREILTFKTAEEAIKAKANMEKAFGSQLWAGIREKRV